MRAHSYGYQQRFVPAVERRDKRQTIRPEGKNAADAGDMVRHYEHWRKPGCRKIAQGMCLESIPLVRWDRGDWWKRIGDHRVGVRHTGERLSPAQMRDLADRDGFESVEELEDWFERYPKGQHLRVIRW
jgi:hypothetical protein